MAELTIEASPSCDLNCIHCSHDKEYESGVDYPGLEIEEILECVDKHPEFDKIRISGGEPFRYAPLVELVAELNRRGKTIEILTSGVSRVIDNVPQPLPEQTLSELGEVSNMAFSIYGNREVHETVTRVVDSYDCMNSSIDRVRKREIPFSFNFVAMRSSIPGLELAIQYAGLKKAQARMDRIDFRVLRFIKQGEGRVNDSQALSEEEIKGVIQRATSYGNRYGAEVRYGCSLLGKGCSAGTGKAVLTSDGKYIPCSALKEISEPFTPGSLPCKKAW